MLKNVLPEVHWMQGTLNKLIFIINESNNLNNALENHSCTQVCITNWLCMYIFYNLDTLLQTVALCVFLCATEGKLP